jgi:hypothetical protein
VEEDMVLHQLAALQKKFAPAADNLAKVLKVGGFFLITYSRSGNAEATSHVMCSTTALSMFRLVMAAGV